jgi:hypothetical protein
MPPVWQYEGMKKSVLRVETEFGTFTRQTNRVYTHLVASSNLIPETDLRARDIRAIGDQLRNIREYRKSLAEVERGERDWGCRIPGKTMAESYVEWIAKSEARIEELKSITDEAYLAEAATPEVICWGWTSRLDLAQKLVSSTASLGVKNVRIFEV